MFGAIVGSIGGGIVNNVMGGGGQGGGGGMLSGLFDGILGGGGQGGGGLLSGLGDIGQQLLAPLGNLFGGGQGQEQASMPEGGDGEVKALMNEIKGLMEDILAQFKGQEDGAGSSDGAGQASSAALSPGGPITINGGSGDDVITIGQPVAAG